MDKPWGVGAEGRFGETGGFGLAGGYWVTGVDGSDLGGEGTHASKRADAMDNGGTKNCEIPKYGPLASGVPPGNRA